MPCPICAAAPRPPSAANDMNRVGRLVPHLLAAVAVFTGPVLVGCSKNSDDTAAFCAAIAAAPSLDSILRGFTDQEPLTLTRNLDEAQEAYGRVRDTAPAGITDETEALVEVVDLVIDAVRENPDDRRSVLETVQTAMATKDPVDDDAALIAETARDRCGIDLNAGLVPTVDDDATDGNTDPAPTSTEPD